MAIFMNDVPIECLVGLHSASTCDDQVVWDNMPLGLAGICKYTYLYYQIITLDCLISDEQCGTWLHQHVDFQKTISGAKGTLQAQFNVAKSTKGKLRNVFQIVHV